MHNFTYGANILFGYIVGPRIPVNCEITLKIIDLCLKYVILRRNSPHLHVGGQTFCSRAHGAEKYYCVHGRAGDPGGILPQ